MRKILFISLFLVLAGIATALPQIPSEYYGTIISNSPMEGIAVVAEIDGVKYSQVSYTHYDGVNWYDVIIKADDNETLQKEGGINGDLITIKIGAYVASPNLTWQTGNRSSQLTIIPISGDPNYDGKVNIFDLANVGVCYSQSPTGTCANSDLNNDGQINIFDLATVGWNYGRSC